MYEIACFYINISRVCGLLCRSGITGGFAVRLLVGIAVSNPAGSRGCLCSVCVVFS